MNLAVNDVIRDRVNQSRNHPDCNYTVLDDFVSLEMVPGQPEACHCSQRQGNNRRAHRHQHTVGKEGGDVGFPEYLYVIIEIERIDPQDRPFHEHLRLCLKRRDDRPVNRKEKQHAQQKQNDEKSRRL